MRGIGRGGGGRAGGRGGGGGGIAGDGGGVPTCACKKREIGWLTLHNASAS